MHQVKPADLQGKDEVITLPENSWSISYNRSYEPVVATYWLYNE